MPLLGIALSKPVSFPVGKVEFMELGPMTFTEFLMADGDNNLVEYLGSLDNLEPLPDAFFNPLYEKLKMYFVTGGMPESVYSWIKERETDLIESVLSNILGSYERDFAKHPDPKDFPKISMIWKSIPSQLSRENKKFIYKAVKEGARAREYEDAIQWLSDAALIYKVYRNTAPGLPIMAYDDLSAFKIYMGMSDCSADSLSCRPKHLPKAAGSSQSSREHSVRTMSSSHLWINLRQYPVIGQQTILAMRSISSYKEITRSFRWK